MPETETSFLEFIRDHSDSLTNYKNNLVLHRNFFMNRMMLLRNMQDAMTRKEKLGEIKPTIDMLNDELIQVKSPEFQVVLGRKCINTFLE